MCGHLSAPTVPIVLARDSRKEAPIAVRQVHAFGVTYCERSTSRYCRCRIRQLLKSRTLEVPARMCRVLGECRLYRSFGTKTSS